MGIGFAMLKNKKIIKLKKGVYLDVRDIAKEIRQTSYDWVIFHTRVASVGKVSDRNCHPFKRNDTILAMNGTESSVEFLSDSLEITDTEAILETIDKYKLSVVALKKLSSIFMGFSNGKPFVVAGNTHNIKVLKKKNSKALVFASSFPQEFKSNIYEAIEKFIWNEDNLPKTLKKYKNKSPIVKFSDYVYEDYYNDYYGQYYLKAMGE